LARSDLVTMDGLAAAAGPNEKGQSEEEATQGILDYLGTRRRESKQPGNSKAKAKKPTTGAKKSFLEEVSRKDKKPRKDKKHKKDKKSRQAAKERKRQRIPDDSSADNRRGSQLEKRQRVQSTGEAAAPAAASAQQRLPAGPPVERVVAQLPTPAPTVPEDTVSTPPIEPDSAAEPAPRRKPGRQKKDRDPHKRAQADAKDARRKSVLKHAAEAWHTVETLPTPAYDWLPHSRWQRTVDAVAAGEASAEEDSDRLRTEGTAMAAMRMLVAGGVGTGPQLNISALVG
jgi:hypothetical protein